MNRGRLFGQSVWGLRKKRYLRIDKKEIKFLHDTDLDREDVFVTSSIIACT